MEGDLNIPPPLLNSNADPPILGLITAHVMVYLSSFSKQHDKLSNTGRKYSYANSVNSFAGTMKSFAGMAFLTNIKRKIESSYQPVNLLSINPLTLAL